MLSVKETMKVYVFSEPVDMRKNIDGLSFLVSQETDLKLQDEALFLFHNKSRDKVKVLYWHKNGFVLLYKRLEHGKFKISQRGDLDYASITSTQYEWLLAGLDYELMHAFPEMNYPNYA